MLDLMKDMVLDHTEGMVLGQVESMVLWWVGGMTVDIQHQVIYSKCRLAALVVPTEEDQKECPTTFPQRSEPSVLDKTWLW